MNKIIYIISILSFCTLSFSQTPEKSKSKIDAIIGGSLNSFSGQPNEYLKIGGGLRTEATYTTNNNLIIGLSTNLYWNKLKKEYPLNANSVQSTPLTLFAGFVIGKWCNNFGIQAEFTLASQGLTEDKIRTKGWSPGLAFHLPIKLGTEKSSDAWRMPTIEQHNLDFVIGLRYLFLGLDELSGIMTEIGFSYRLTNYIVKK